MIGLLSKDSSKDSECAETLTVEKNECARRRGQHRVGEQNRDPPDKMMISRLGSEVKHSHLADCAALRDCSGDIDLLGKTSFAAVGSNSVGLRILHHPPAQIHTKLITFDQFCPWDVTYHFRRPTSRSQIVEEVMNNFAELMQRLVEIHRDEKRSPKLIAEDEQLMRSLEKKNLAEKSGGSCLDQFAGA
jgi:hypothetical protein